MGEHGVIPGMGGGTRGIRHPFTVSLTPPHIYQFHQRNGFACVLLSDVLELV